MILITQNSLGFFIKSTKGEIMTVPVQVVAHTILQKNKSVGRDTTSLQIIKLAYLAHGWHLAFFDESLFRAQVEAWPYGPVIPALYSKVKSFRGNPIDTELFSDKIKGSELSDTQQHAIDEVMRVYGAYDGIKLSTLTHREGTPWSLTFLGNVITTELIQEHFKKILTKNQDE